MKKKTSLILAIFATALIGLSSCKALFNDDDLSIYNSFNSIVSIPKSETEISGEHAGA